MASSRRTNASRAGKPRAGTITLTVARRGQVVTVQVADDGRGLNLRDIRSRAVERGLLAADAMPTDAEIARLTLLPGFSTRDMVTEISGRGVGLDVVATRLRALVRLHRYPLRSRPRPHDRTALPGIAGGHARAVRARRRPGIRHRQPRRAPRGSRRGSGARRARTARCSRASTTKIPGARARRRSPACDCASSPERRNLVLVDSESGPIGVLVDAVLDASELVTRPTGRYLKRIPGVAGIGLTGNGSVIPLLDVAELARTPARPCDARRRRSALASAGRCAARACSVVDDSMSVRRAVATLLEDQGYEIALARDGLEAVKSMEVRAPRRAAHRSRNAQHERPRAHRARALAHPSSPACRSS